MTSYAPVDLEAPVVFRAEDISAVTAAIRNMLRTEANAAAAAALRHCAVVIQVTPNDFRNDFSH